MKRSGIWMCSLLIYMVFPMALHAGQLEKGAAAMEDGNYKLAYQILYPLAEEGNAAAQDYVGTMLCEGLGVGMDEYLAVSWYEKSAAQGYAKAQYSLGFMYVNGRGVEKNRLKGISLISQAAQEGLIVAQQDAYDLYMELAKEDNAVASFNVGIMCLKGWAGDVKPYDCMGALETAAKGGFAKSASALAQIYSEGSYGIEPDEEKAAYWENYAESLLETDVTE